MKRHINLLPRSFRRRQLIRQRLIFWSAVWSLTVAMGCLLFWGQYQRYGSQRSLLRARQAEYAPVQQMLDDLTGIRQRIEELQQRESLALSLADEQPLVLVIGVVSRAARQSGGDLFVEHLALNRSTSRRALRGGAGGGPEASSARRLLTLEGLAMNHPAVLSFVDQLRSQSVFQRVELKSCEGVETPSGLPARSYLVECVF